MGHNSVVSSYPKSTEIPHDDGLSMEELRFVITQGLMCIGLISNRA